MVTVRVCSKLKQAENRLFGKNSRYFVGIFKSRLPLVGYEMIIANSYPTCTCAKIVKCYIRQYKFMVVITVLLHLMTDVHYIQHTSGHWYQNKRCTAPCFNHVCQHGWLIKEAGVHKEVFKKVTLIKHEYINHLKMNLRDPWQESKFSYQLKFGGFLQANNINLKI